MKHNFAIATERKTATVFTVADRAIAGAPQQPNVVIDNLLRLPILFRIGQDRPGQVMGLLVIIGLVLPADNMQRRNAPFAANFLGFLGALARHNFLLGGLDESMKGKLGHAH